MAEKVVLMQGNEACVEGAIAAGMRFYAGYPITPSTEIAELSSVRLPQVGGKFMQMEDEISSMAAVLGASAVGMKAMTATSGPGFTLKQENLGYGTFVELPCVVVDVQRLGPSTGLATAPAQGDYMQARWGTHGDHPIIVLSPSSVLETYTLIIRAFNLAEKYRIPVIFLMDEIIGHLREGITIPDPSTYDILHRKTSNHPGNNRVAYFVPEGEYVPTMKPFGQGERYNISGLVHDQSGFPVNANKTANDLNTRLLAKIEDNVDDITDVQEYRMDDAEIAVVCFGGTARAVMDAVIRKREDGKKVGVFRPITVWPFPEKQLLKHLPHLKKILVAEHNHGQMLLEVQRVCGKDIPIEFIGRVDGTVIPPNDILNKLKDMEEK